MKLQRIIAKDSRTANDQAITRFGKDVLVVSNSKVNGMTELIVAVDIEHELNAAPKTNNNASYLDSFKHSLAQQSEDFNSGACVVNESINQTKLYSSKIAPLNNINNLNEKWTNNQAETAESSIIPTSDHTRPAEEDTHEFIQSTLNKVGMCESPSNQASTDIHSLIKLIQNELKQLRTEVRVSQQLQAWSTKGALHRWNEAMCNVGMEASLRALLLSDMSAEYSDEEAIGAIESQLNNHMLKAKMNLEPNDIFSQPGIHVFAGPAGCGKTSMLAKIAYQLTQNYSPDEVIMVSWCDVRPGSWSQLQMWAAKMGAFTYRALDTQTLDTILSENKGKYILIDTPSDKLDDIKYLMKQPEVNSHIILPANTHAAQVRKWINPDMSKLWTDLYITRMDESVQPWSLLVEIMNNDIHVSKASDGVNIKNIIYDFDLKTLMSHALFILKSAVKYSDVTTDIDQFIIQPTATQVANAVQFGDDLDHNISDMNPKHSRNFNPHGIVFQ